MPSPIFQSRPEARRIDQRPRSGWNGSGTFGFPASNSTGNSSGGAGLAIYDSRLSYRLYINQGTNSAAANKVRDAEEDQEYIIIRNPDATNNIRVGIRSDNLQNILQPNNPSTWPYTIGPGQELFVNGIPGQYYAEWADGVTASVPAGLYVDIEVKLGKKGPGDTATIRTITPNTQNRYSVSNVNSYADNGVMHLCLDRKTFLGRDPAVPNKLRYSTNFDTSPGSPTWTDITTLAFSGTPKIFAIQELYDGELLVYVSQTAAAPNKTRVYRSTGWNVNNPLAATWALTFTTTSGYANYGYSGHDYCHGTDGYVVLSEYGAQTTGVPATDETAAAIHAFASVDGGRNFTQFFDLIDYSTAQGYSSTPVNLHLHGCLYHQAWGRVWLSYGDGTQGESLATPHFSKLIYSDNVFVNGAVNPTPTWNTFPQDSMHWDTTTATPTACQFVGMAFSDNAIVFLPDVNKPRGCFVFPIVGYRTLGNPHVLQGDNVSISGEVQPKRNSVGDTVGGVPSAYIMSGLYQGGSITGTIHAKQVLTKDFKEFSEIVIDQAVTAKTIYGFSRCLGPTINGKVVLSTDITADSSLMTAVADLSYGQF